MENCGGQNCKSEEAQKLSCRQMGFQFPKTSRSRKSSQCCQEPVYLVWRLSQTLNCQKQASTFQCCPWTSALASRWCQCPPCWGSWSSLICSSGFRKLSCRRTKSDWVRIWLYKSNWFHQSSQTWPSWCWRRQESPFCLDWGAARWCLHSWTGGSCSCSRPSCPRSPCRCHTCWPGWCKSHHRRYIHQICTKFKKNCLSHSSATIKYYQAG